MRLLKEIRTLMGNYHVKSGMYHYYRSEFAPAVEFFRKALRDPALTESDRRTARYYLTMTFMTSAERKVGKGEVEEAIADFQRAVEVSPTYPDIRYRLGRTLERLCRHEEAIEQYRQATACQRDYLDAQVALAFCLLASRRQDEAVAAMQRALELKIQRIRTPFDRGLERLREGAWTEAGDFFHTAFLSEPQRFEEEFQAALDKLKAEDYEQALEHLDQGLSLNPRYPDIHNYRGIALCELGRVDEGVEAFREATSLNPSYLVPWLNLAFALVRAGRLKDAERELEAILKKDPTEPTALAKLEELQTGRAPERRRSTARGASS